MLDLTPSDLMLRTSEVEISAEHLEEYKAIREKESSESVKIEPGILLVTRCFKKRNRIRSESWRSMPTRVRIGPIYKRCISFITKQQHCEDGHVIKTCGDECHRC